MKLGYVKIYRQLQDHWLYQEKPFCPLAAWVDLITRANHKTVKLRFDRELITLQRGQFITSTVRLADHWGWSRTKVSNFLETLEKDGMIKKVSDRRKTTITLCNYTYWQEAPTTVEQVEHHNEAALQLEESTPGTAHQPLKDTDKNDNHEKQDNQDNNQKNALHDYMDDSYTADGGSAALLLQMGQMGDRAGNQAGNLAGNLAVNRATPLSPSLSQVAGNLTGDLAGNLAKTPSQGIPEVDDYQWEKRYRAIVDLYHEYLEDELYRVIKLTDKRKAAMRARWQEYYEKDRRCNPLYVFERLFQITSECEFLLGYSDRGWKASFDWLLEEKNMKAVLHNKYASYY